MKKPKTAPLKTQNTTPARASGLKRSSLGLMALEQRFMFDGAALADSIAVVSDALQPQETSETSASQSLFDLTVGAD